MQKSIIKIVKTYDEPFDCEDCGTCYPEGLYVEYNHVVVWEKFSDGHYSGHQTEESILDCILGKWYNDLVIVNEENKTEEKRLEWNKQHPGNAIAKTKESWQEYHNESFEYVKGSLESIRKNCENLPYEEELQVKMIALWIQNDTGEEIEIQSLTEKIKD